MKDILLLLSSITFFSLFVYKKTKRNQNADKLDITNEWDKTSNLSAKVIQKK